MKYKLSVLIPARNEQFLSKTIEDLIEHKRGDTEILVGLDGVWTEPTIKDHPDVMIFYVPESIGQRAMCNQLVRLSKAKYVMKIDAHCSVKEGFDVEMIKAMEEAGDNVTMVPAMYNLWVFDWICEDGHRRYQSPPGVCKVCGKETKQVIMWRVNAEIGDTARVAWKRESSPKSVSYCFDSTPHFQYFKEYMKRPEYIRDLESGITETMSLQGSCFMLTREKYWELGVCDESFGSWGSQGIEVACKTWLSGGRVLVNHRTWYAHFFRVGGIGFPYHLSQSKVDEAKKKAKDLFFNSTFKGQIKPLSWLIEKFSPVKGWTDEDLNNLKNNSIH